MSFLPFKAVSALVKISTCAKFSFRVNGRSWEGLYTFTREMEGAYPVQGWLFSLAAKPVVGIDLQPKGTRFGRGRVAGRLLRGCREAEVLWQCCSMKWYSTVIRDIFCALLVTKLYAWPSPQLRVSCSFHLTFTVVFLHRRSPVPAHPIKQCTAGSLCNISGGFLKCVS